MKIVVIFIQTIMLFFFIPSDTRKYFDQGCHCAVGDTKSGCVKQFEFDVFEETMLSLRELTKEQLDSVILGQLQAVTPSSLSSKRKILPSSYMYWGLGVCRETFCFIHSVSEKRLTALEIHLNIEGVTERLHGNTKRVSVNATMHEQTEKLKLFIENYVNINAVVPDRIPGYNSWSWCYCQHRTI